MELAVREMLLSRSEHTAKSDPLVGAVLVDRRGKELARAHRGTLSAGDHAEFTVLERLLPDVDLEGSTAYVTLEPCTVRRAPKVSCAQRLVERRVGRVVIGMTDPNPDICGRGIQHLLMFRDRLVVRSPGVLLQPLTLESLRGEGAVPYSRNPRIADTCYHLGLMEQRGSGIPGMRLRMAKLGLRAPEFEQDAGCFKVVLWGSPLQVGPEVLTELTPRQRHMLELLLDHGRLTSNDFREQAKVSRDTVHQNFQRLLELRLIERRGAGRGVHYVPAAR